MRCLYSLPMWVLFMPFLLWCRRLEWLFKPDPEPDPLGRCRWRSVQRVIYARSQVVGLAFNYYVLRRFMLYPRSPDMFELHNA